VKERLTGAIIVVAALVLLVPELLTGPSPKTGAKPTGAESGPMRSYTIDLADDSEAGRSSSAAPTSAAPTTVTEDPVATAKADEGDESASGSTKTGVEPAPGTEGAAVDPEAPSAASSVSSQNERSADSASETASGSKPGNSDKPGSSASVEAERPRSAFGPNASRPAPENASKPAREGSTAAASSAAPAANVPAGRKGAETAGAPSRSTATSSDAKPSKGFAVQLGVFASRENAERLAKQVKGKGYPVTVHETSGAKHLFRVRVGPEKDRAAADALNARLRATGHSGTVVPYP